jgi:type I toxin-antitoxin system toxin SymE
MEFESVQGLRELSARRWISSTAQKYEVLCADRLAHLPRRLTVGYAHTNERGIRVPNLRLSGHWLHAAGFVIGRHVKIEVDEARLMIEQVD